MSNTVYSPKEVILQLGGVKVDGWNTISLGRNEDNSSETISADGRVATTWNADNTGTLEVEVQQQNTPVNFFLSALQLKQDTLNSPLYLGGSLTDPAGNILCEMKGVYLKTPARQDLAKEETSRTWGFFVSDLKYLAVPAKYAGDAAAVSTANSAVNTVLENSINKS